ncbi:Permeases of the major facilitator superfamily [Paramagnetospirillum magnetotacticum MS-1]|uniref:Permeases of the major facilitator superfamily n=1 Tax=Paramagnetospirillum magnetotacticum MS-1 TaxID=272627 RepID=A0A0C2U5U8_PARME|nr:hypothetical protein [Paramagnetospirillum magnetotacticum]KIL96827.1 Permeases of the major facilitator superfamily [Paramagnetospirillum magnetotacticum MS-1]
MITAGEIIAGVFGAWRLARRDPTGLIWFDSSPRGFVNSFWGPALILPGFLVLQTLDGTFETDLLRPLAVELIAYVIGCVSFPLAMSHISEGLERSHLYTRFVVAYNWSQVIQMAVLLPAGLLIHLAPSDGMAMLNMAATIVVLVYQAYVAHQALDVKPASAGLLVLLDLSLGALIQMIANRLMGA